jgi:hypothetical protein
VTDSNAQSTTTGRRHVTVTIGRHTLLALARGEAVHLEEVDADGVVTLIHASDYPAALLLLLEKPDVGLPSELLDDRPRDPFSGDLS